MMAKTPAPRPPKKNNIATPWLLPIAPPQAVSAAQIAAKVGSLVPSGGDVSVIGGTGTPPSLTTEANLSVWDQ